MIITNKVIMLILIFVFISFLWWLCSWLALGLCRRKPGFFQKTKKTPKYHSDLAFPQLQLVSRSCFWFLSKELAFRFMERSVVKCVLPLDFSTSGTFYVFLHRSGCPAPQWGWCSLLQQDLCKMTTMKITRSTPRRITLNLSTPLSLIEMFWTTILNLEQVVPSFQDLKCWGKHFNHHELIGSWDKIICLKTFYWLLFLTTVSLLMPRKPWYMLIMGFSRPLSVSFLIHTSGISQPSSAKF